MEIMEPSSLLSLHNCFIFGLMLVLIIFLGDLDCL